VMYARLSEMVALERRRDIDRQVKGNALLREAKRAAASPEPVMLRLSTVDDEAAVARLATLESRPVPKVRCVVADAGGTVVAALPLDGGAPLADPFRRTAHLIPLLELRAGQLAEPPPRRRTLSLRGAVRLWGKA
jgi:hypothetical protein